MRFVLTTDEATAIVVAAQIVKTQYEIENETRTDAYEALKSGVERMEIQLWGYKSKIESTDYTA